MKKTALRALIWDVDGTVAETERDGHRVAFNQALAEHGAPWQWDVPTYGRLLRVAGGFERLVHDMEGRPEAPASMAERERFARSVHQRKNQLYVDIVAMRGMRARPGVRRLMEECSGAGIALSIARPPAGRTWRRSFRACSVRRGGRASERLCAPKMHRARSRTRWPIAWRSSACASTRPRRWPWRTRRTDSQRPLRPASAP